MSNQLFDAYFTAPAMREVFCDRGRLQGMLDFEAALARAEAPPGWSRSAVAADRGRMQGRALRRGHWPMPSPPPATRRFRW
jgi:hypothetical protein